MFGIGKAFGRKKEAVAQASLKAENRDLMQGCVAIGFVVMWADGNAGEAEMKKLEKSLQAHPALKVFGNELDKTISEFEDIFGTSFRQGRIRAYKEIADLKGYDDDTKATILSIGLDIAEAEGTIGAEEEKVLRECAKSLSYDLNKLL